MLVGVGAVVAVGLVLAVWSMFREGGGTSAKGDHPDGVGRYCPKCNKGFVVSNSDFAKHQKEHWGEPFACPHCGTPTEGGVICPHCKAVFRRDRANPRTTCPECGKPLK